MLVAPSVSDCMVSDCMVSDCMVPDCRSGFDGRFVKGHAVGALGGELAEGVVHEHEFVGGESAFVAGPEAGFALVAFVIA